MRTTTITWSPEESWSQDPASVEARPDSSVALVFADPLVDSGAAMAELGTALPGTAIIGCSTAGQILGNRVDPAPLVAAVASFDNASVVATFMAADGRDGTEVGAALASSLLEQAAGGHIAGVLVLGGGLHINGSALVAGLTSTLPAGTPVSGGLAADGPRFEQTWVHCNGRTDQDCVAAFAVIGRDVEFSHGSQGGWDGFGPKRTITRSAGNVLFELDGQPALGLYKQYLGDRAGELPGAALLFPLTVADPENGTSVVRTILAVDEDDQSMTFAGDVPQGWSARLMWTTTERLMEGATEAAEDSAQDGAGLAVAISCVGRRLVLGDRTDEELDSVVEVLGERTPVVGFYSYGEISPVHGNCALHNQTMTITTIRENDPAP